MAEQPHIIIIGAGLIGLSTADALASRGASVTVIEARSGPCEGTSFSNSGMIHPSQAQTWLPSLSKTEVQNAARVTVGLGQRSAELLNQQMKRLGLPQRQTDCLKLYNDIETARLAQSEYEAIDIKANIVTDAIDTFGRPACQFPNDASGDSRVFGCALAEDLESRGVKFIYNARDVEIAPRDGQAVIQFSAFNKEQSLKADHLVLAAGVHTVDLLAKLGIRMQLQGVSGAAADFALPEEQGDLPYCPVMDAQSRSALTVFEDRVRISGGVGLTTPDSLIARWRDIAPGLMLRLGTPLSTWTGVRPVSPVGRPYISQTSIENMWVNTGHGHMGWTLCAGSGELLAEMILENRQETGFSFSG